MGTNTLVPEIKYMSNTVKEKNYESHLTKDEQENYLIDDLQATTGIETELYNNLKAQNQFLGKLQKEITQAHNDVKSTEKEISKLVEEKDVVEKEIKELKEKLEQKSK